MALGELLDEQRRRGWLIEAPGYNYLGVRKLQAFCDFTWTRDPNKALQFKSEEQADLMMTALRGMNRDLFAFDVTLSPARATEHVWMMREAEAA